MYVAGQNTSHDQMVYVCAYWRGQTQISRERILKFKAARNKISSNKRFKYVFSRQRTIKNM